MAPGCVNTFYRNVRVHYHRLPVSNPAQLKQWLQVMKRKECPDLKYARVCSEHFTDEDYVFKGSFAADGSFNYTKTSDLKKGVCPSRFDFSAYDVAASDRSSTSSSLSQERLVRRQRRHNSKVCVFSVFW